MQISYGTHLEGKVFPRWLHVCICREAPKQRKKSGKGKEEKEKQKEIKVEVEVKEESEFREDEEPPRKWVRFFMNIPLFVSFGQDSR